MGIDNSNPYIHSTTVLCDDENMDKMWKSFFQILCACNNNNMRNPSLHFILRGNACCYCSTQLSIVCILLNAKLKDVEEEDVEEEDDGEIRVLVISCICLLGESIRELVNSLCRDSADTPIKP